MTAVMTAALLNKVARSALHAIAIAIAIAPLIRARLPGRTALARYPPIHGHPPGSARGLLAV